jgi:hypothetical protein
MKGIFLCRQVPIFCEPDDFGKCNNYRHFNPLFYHARIGTGCLPSGVTFAVQKGRLVPEEMA